MCIENGQSVMSYHGSSHEEVPGQQCPQTEHEEDQPDAKIPAGRCFQNKMITIFLCETDRN